MSAAEKEPSPIARVAKWFEATDHDVYQTVGEKEGTTDWFFIPRKGVVRPKTYLTVWERVPVQMELALEELDQKRAMTGADRALAVVLNGQVSGEWERGDTSVSAMSARRLLLELSGIFEALKQDVLQYERQRRQERYLPRQASTYAGEVIDPVEYIQKCCQSGRIARLTIAGEPGTGKTAVIEHAYYLSAKNFLSHPENEVVPIHLERRLVLVTDIVVLLNVWCFGPKGQSPVFTDGLIGFVTEAQYGTEISASDEGLILALPSDKDVDNWFRKVLSSSGGYGFFAEAYSSNEAFRKLAQAPANWDKLADAMAMVILGAGEDASKTYIVSIVSAYISLVRAEFGEGYFRRFRNVFDLLPVVAMEEFALGHSPSAGVTELHFQGVPNSARTWLVLDESDDDWPKRIDGFSNPIIRDYFMAEHIVSEVRAGRLDILIRYQFPREYVLLFLAILAPDVAALIGEDRSAQMRAEIETEVQRRLQMTLAHHLKRSAGAARTHAKKIARLLDPVWDKLDEARREELKHYLDRLEREVGYQIELAERTRLWGVGPEKDSSVFAVSALIRDVLAPLRSQHPQVQVQEPPESTLSVRLNRDGLREVLHCLLENAFHASLACAGGLTPSVRIEMRLIDESIRIEIIDNGPGIAESDQAHIFDPYVTTKKGGNGPMGTGLGLPIARRWAEQMGGRVELDPSQPQTCFVLRLVAYRPTTPEEH